MNTTATTNAATTGFGLGLSTREEMESSFVHGLTAFGNKAAELMDQSVTSAAAPAPSLLHNMMTSLSSAAGFDGSFEEAFGGFLPSKRESNTNENLAKSLHRNEGGGGGGNDGLTRDFLGLRAFSHRDILNMAGLDSCMNPTSYEQTQTQKPW